MRTIRNRNKSKGKDQDQGLERKRKSRRKVKSGCLRNRYENSIWDKSSRSKSRRKGRGMC